MPTIFFRYISSPVLTLIGMMLLLLYSKFYRGIWARDRNQYWLYFILILFYPFYCWQYKVQSTKIKGQSCFVLHQIYDIYRTNVWSRGCKTRRLIRWKTRCEAECILCPNIFLQRQNLFRLIDFLELRYPGCQRHRVLQSSLQNKEKDRCGQGQHCTGVFRL